MKRALFAFLVVAGCTCELDDPPPTTDGPPLVPPGCGATAVPSCWDDCCFERESATIDPTTCAARCSPGMRPVFDFETCAPAPGCGLDGGGPPGCVTDLGPAPLCSSGPCCGETVAGVFDPVTCNYSCPEGGSFACVPDPTCEEDLRECDDTSDCRLVSRTCCGECTEQTLEGSTAIAHARYADYFDSMCALVGPCDPACTPQFDPALVATCNAAHCAAVDLSRLPLAACTRDEECRVRSAACCECGADLDPASLIAVRADGVVDLLGLVCDTDAACDACEPSYPEGVGAACLGGRCGLVFEVEPGG